MAAKDTKTKEAVSAIAAPWSTERTHISVRAPGHEDTTRWRAGRKFSMSPVIIAKGDLSDDEALLIARDDRLSVEEIDAPA